MVYYLNLNVNYFVLKGVFLDI